MIARMRRIALALLLLSGCSTVADLQERPAFIEATSTKTSDQLAQCFADQWHRRSGTVNSTPRAGGFTMTLTYMVYSNAVPAAVIDVDDQSGSRRVVVHARNGDDGSKLKREISACL
jgi:uncharacterized protein YceK